MKTRHPQSKEHNHTLSKGKTDQTQTLKTNKFAMTDILNTILPYSNEHTFTHPKRQKTPMKTSTQHPGFMFLETDTTSEPKLTLRDSPDTLPSIHPLKSHDYNNPASHNIVTKIIKIKVADHAPAFEARESSFKKMNQPVKITSMIKESSTSNSSKDLKQIISPYKTALNDPELGLLDDICKSDICAWHK